MKKLLASLFLASIVSLGVNAQILPSAHPQADSVAFAKVRARMDSIRQYRPTVGLVLAGGGAKGTAHVGVLRFLEEQNIPIDIITGTNMGGLVGGLLTYCLGIGAIPTWWMLSLWLVLSLALMFARLRLDAHTPAQVCAGWLTGMFCTFIPYCIYWYVV